MVIIRGKMTFAGSDLARHLHGDLARDLHGDLARDLHGDLAYHQDRTMTLVTPGQ